jgi:hypothetical protein
LSKLVLECLIVYKYADFTHTRVPRIRFVRKNDNLLVLTIEIDFRGVYVRFTLAPTFEAPWRIPLLFCRNSLQSSPIAAFRAHHHVFCRGKVTPQGNFSLRVFLFPPFYFMSLLYASKKTQGLVFPLVKPKDAFSMHFCGLE